MSALRWPFGVLLVLAVGLASCTDDDARSTDRVDTGSGAGSDTTTTDAGDVGGGSYELPFGLRAVDGLTAIGRPAVSPSVDPTAPGSVELTAAFRVDADDPAGAFDAFVGQLGQSDELRFGDVSVDSSDGDRTDPWLSAGGEGRDYLDLQLWTTEDRPILLVTVIQRPGDGDAEATTAGGPVDAGDPPASSLAWDERADGDVLFDEQGTDIHVPVGGRALAPTVPVFCGTGGSFSVLSADDGRAAVDALVAEAQASSSDGQTDGPDERDAGGVKVVTADFYIPAGGWSFDVVSVQGPDDGSATLYVSSCAD